MNLEALRKAKGLSQDELRKLSGVSQTHISYIERGIKQPTIPIIKKLAVALGVSVSKLLGDNKPKKVV